MSSSAASTAKAGRLRDCTLAFPSDLAFPGPYGDKVRLIGGMKMGYPDKHQTRFFFTNRALNTPFVGIRIYFRGRQADYDAPDLSTTEYTITIKLLAGTFTSFGKKLSPQEVGRLPHRMTTKDDALYVLRFTLKYGEVPQVESSGIPVASEPEDQDILVNDAKIDGVMSLRELYHQRKYEVIISNYEGKLAIVNDQFRPFF